jgi:hypothetical protein
MHEFGLADDLLGAASAEAARAGGRPAKIGVRLGRAVSIRMRCGCPSMP